MENTNWQQFPFDKFFNVIKSYVENTPKQGVVAFEEPAELREHFDMTLPDLGRSHDEVVKDLEAYLEHARNTLHPTFANQLYAAPLPIAFIGDAVAAMGNSTMATYEAAPIGTLLERALIHNLGKYIGWDRTEGVMVTGGSNANFSGLLLARNTRFPETRRFGNGNTRFSVFVSEEAHYSFFKALNQLGIGTDNLIPVPSDSQGRMRASELDRLIKAAKERGFTPMCVAATAGTTVLGAFDPLDEIADVCKQHNLWLHVDAAWGGGTLLSTKHKAKLKGIERADSVTWDTHKMLGTGLVSSFILTPHIGSLLASQRGGGNNYLFHDGQENTLDLGPMSLQCGRRVDALKVWLSWRLMGDKGWNDLIDTLYSRAQWMAREIKKRPDLQLLYEPESLNVCFRYLPKRHYLANTAVRPIRDDLIKRGDAMINWSSRTGESFLRFIVVHPGADEKVLGKILDDVIAAGQRWEASHA
ncbi:MAG: aminotransferase class V-fold PLP-dependent enzyme [Bacteriovoracaceae bacterium]|nr:aminotransferase class V-fold PLP-dependent enzyme [Bacteriovoracaceae bacterium]